MSTATQNVPQSSRQGEALAEGWQHRAAQKVDRVQGVIHDNAGTSLLIALASGLGVGILIGMTIGGSKKSSHWWDRSTAEGLGRRLLDKFESIVPDAVSERIHR